MFDIHTVRESIRNKKREIYLLVLSPNGLKAWGRGQGQTKSRSLTFHQSLPHDGRYPDMWSIPCYFPRHFSGETGLEVEHLGVKLVLIWDVDVTGCSLIDCIMALSLNLKGMIKGERKMEVGLASAGLLTKCLQQPNGVK